MEKQPIESEFFIEFLIIIDNATRNRATQKELKTLDYAFFLAKKYYPRLEKEEF